MTTRKGRVRRLIETLPSGSLRVNVYAGVDPVSKKRLYLDETIPAGPGAAKQAEKRGRGCSPRSTSAATRAPGPPSTRCWTGT